MRAEIEKINLNIDIQKLQKDLLQIIHLDSGTLTVPAIESWALQSNTGKNENLFDGSIPCINGPMNRNPSWEDLEKYSLKRRVQDMVFKTNLCQGHFDEILIMLDQNGFWPRNSRINCMKPKMSTSLHRDTKIDQYAVALHIPIFSNSECYAVIHNKKIQMVADGSGYLCNINYPHQFFNHGQTPRYHMMAIVWDTKGLTSHFKYQYDYIPMESSLPIDKAALESA